MDHSSDPKNEPDDESDDAGKKPEPASASASTIDAKTAREISENDDSPVNAVASSAAGDAAFPQSRPRADLERASGTASLQRACPGDTRRSA